MSGLVGNDGRDSSGSDLSVLRMLADNDAFQARLKAFEDRQTAAKKAEAEAEAKIALIGPAENITRILAATKAMRDDARKEIADQKEKAEAEAAAIIQDARDAAAKIMAEAEQMRADADSAKASARAELGAARKDAAGIMAAARREKDAQDKRKAEIDAKESDLAALANEVANTKARCEAFAAAVATAQAAL
jgi:colicin import membrane protein